MQVIFSYGDLGLTYSRSMVFLGCMLGVLAVLPALEKQGEAEVNTMPELKRARTGAPEPVPAGAKSA
jgi:hypothetical protein